MALPKYVKDAQNSYNSRLDIIQLKFPKGTKDRIKNILSEGQSMSDYCRQAVFVALECDEEENTQKVKIEPEPQEVEETKEEPEERKSNPPMPLEKLQEFINAKKAEQDRRSEELRKVQKEREEVEKQERQAEYLEIIERLRTGEELEEEQGKATTRQDSIIKANCPF